MKKYKILSGDELVARGTTKTDASLPEVGLKDVLPNGSWLEQKQIQSALEARKHLIEVERIEKCGVLSHAEWNEELMLAEVTQKAGSHWQYLGHNVGKHLYLNPEEALFLMEVNCLQLKHKDVTVSIQQAYSLLLRGKITVLQYRVYSSLSRLGYKVYRHEYNHQTEYEKRINLPQCKKRIKDNCNESEGDGNGDRRETINVIEDSKMDVEEPLNAVSSSSNIENIKETVAEENTVKSSETVNSEENNAIVGQDCSKDNTEMETENVEITEISNCDRNPGTSESNNEVTSESTTSDITTQQTNKDENVRNPPPLIYQNKLQTILDRKTKPINANTVEKCFKNIPDLTEKNIVTVNIPEEQYIPRNVFLNNINYELNLERIRSRTRSSRSSTESRSYSSNEEVNGQHVRRIRDSFPNETERNNWQSNSNPNTYTPQNFQFRPFWRPQMNYYPYIMFQRPFMPMPNTLPRFRLSFPRSLPPLRMFPRPPSFNENRPNQYRKRRRSNTKQVHLQSIRNVAAKLKQLVANSPGVNQDQNIDALQRLISTFNVRYNTRIKLTNEFDISTNDERIVETISLDDDEATNSKRSKSENDVTQSENLDKLNYLASKLKDMENSQKANSRHRRAFSQLLKKFNNTYKTDLYLNSNFDIVDKRYIKLDSSSDSDCVIEETPKTACGKKLKNPFSILKQLAQKSPTATKVNEHKHKDTNKYTDKLKQTFGTWLPDEQDFGKAEIFPQNLEKAFAIETKKEEYIFEFLNSQPYEFENWLDIKTSFLKHVADNSVMMQSEPTLNDSIASLIDSEDCTDTASVLNKLSIIKRNNNINDESALSVHFDVYNRDVQNFKKSSRPKPHFRIVCIDEHTSPPPGTEIATLHSKYEDNVSIMFAVVGSGSISYLQMIPYDLPVYIPSSDLT